MAMWRGAMGAGLLLLLGAGVARAQPPRVEIPIKEVVLSDGEHRYTVPIVVGGVAIEAGLDSGSTGLRILPDVVPATGEQVSSRRETYGYGSGTEFEGAIAEAQMTIGVSGRAKFQQIQKVGCRAGLGTCPAAKVAPDKFGIQGSGLPGEGFKAILGINMAGDDAPNPLMEMGVRRWIIDLPRSGETAPGRLVLNPTDAEVADYKMFAIEPRFGDQRGGLHDAISGCVINQQTKKSYCGPTDLDTGAPGVIVVSPNDLEAWRPGTTVTMAFFDKSKPVLGADFTINKGPGSNFRIRHEPRAQGTTVALGIIPYFVFSALCDPQAKAVGLKTR
jgi:hypothetical protein